MADSSSIDSNNKRYIFIVFISKEINSNKLLEYLGRNSLVIYLAHFIFYKLYISMVISWFNMSVVIST